MSDFPKLAVACEHGRYESHGGCGIARCREEHWYTDPQPGSRLTPDDRATHHDVPQRGYWMDCGFEYSPLYWEPCDHRPYCPGGREISFDEAVERMQVEAQVWCNEHHDDLITDGKFMARLLRAAAVRET